MNSACDYLRIHYIGVYLDFCAVYDLRITSCPASRVADVTSGESRPSLLGYVSNTLGGPAHASCGRPWCPWIVRAVPGQRVQLY